MKVRELKEAEMMSERVNLFRLVGGKNLMLLKFPVKYKLPPKKNKRILK